MPEGHTLHRLAGELTDAFAGRRVAVSSPQGRFAAGAARLDGLTLASAQAWGKHLLIDFAGTAQTLHVHLGLYGSLRLVPGTGVPVTGAVRLRIEGAAVTADLRGPTACELLDPAAVDTLRARLGPDPLRADARPEAAWLRIRASRTAIATLLLDQTVVSGIGNVYRAELLFRRGLDPLLPGTALDRADWQALWADAVALMRQGVLRGRIDTVRAEHEPEAMGRPPRQDDHGGEVYVYRRAGQPCLVCENTVRKQTLAGRNLFWCPGCQHPR